jgi:hypothetical protein
VTAVLTIADFMPANYAHRKVIVRESGVDPDEQCAIWPVLATPLAYDVLAGLQDTLERGGVVWLLAHDPVLLAQAAEAVAAVTLSVDVLAEPEDAA